MKAHLRTHEGCKQKLEKTIENLSNKSRSIDTLEKELKTSELNNQKLEGEVERLKTNLEEVKTLERGGVKRKATTSEENRKITRKTKGNLGV